MSHKRMLLMYYSDSSQRGKLYFNVILKNVITRRVGIQSKNEYSDFVLF